LYIKLKDHTYGEFLPHSLDSPDADAITEEANNSLRQKPVIKTSISKVNSRVEEIL